MNEMEVIHRTKVIIEKLCFANVEELPFCSKLAYWQINKFYGKSSDKKTVQEKLNQNFGENGRIEHGHYSVQTFNQVISAVYGNFSILLRDNASGDYGFPYDVTIIMKNGIAERIILHGNHSEQMLCMVQSDENHFYMLKESDILYIESSHNDLIWHCRDMMITSRGTLKGLEKVLTCCFYRIQRGYIVNVHHIKSMEEREVVMDNNDVLLIPYRTYHKVKRQIRMMCSEKA